MESGFSYGDIIVIGAIAVFILLRYRAMLGDTSVGRDESSSKVTPIADYERVIQLPSARVISIAEKKDDIGAKYGSLAESFVAMRGVDKDFAPDEFIMGARAAYEMVIEAFSKGDRDTLKMLLSKEIYASFDRSLSDSAAEGRKIDTTLVAINKAEFTDAKLKGNTATITVDFVSEQIHLVRDLEGTIIEGNPSLQERVEDQWVFKRNLSAQDPNWTIIET